MRKRDELSDPSSCLNKARDDEWLFVLLGRDAAAPVAVRAWIAERIRSGKNWPDDPQIEEARAWAVRAALDQERQARERKGREDALVLALRGMLLAADASWEEKGQGHDWREACAAARKALAEK